MVAQVERICHDGDPFGKGPRGGCVQPEPKLFDGRPSRSSTSPRPGPRNASAAFGFSGDDRSLDAIIEIALGRAIDARTKAAFPQLAAVSQLLDHVATYTEPRRDLALLKELVSPPTFGFVNGG
jgi:hypothetical protein